MRVLVLNWQDRENPQAGGAEAHLHETFGRLAARGWSITLVASGWKGAHARATLDGIEVHRVGGRHTYPLAVQPHVARAFPPRAFDVVVEDLNKVPVFAPTWAPAPTTLLVHHLFGATAFQEASWPIALATWGLERPIPHLYRGVPTIAVSESTRADLIARGLPAGQIEVIPNGIDLAHFSPPAPGTPRDPEPTLVYLGRLRRYKRVDLLISAVARLHARGRPVRLKIAGRGEHRSTLEAQVAGSGLPAGAVTFLGFISEADKLELLRRSWIHCLTSPKEGWGIANLEAAGCGTPTVASDAPGLRDSVRHGETGFLVPHGNVEALADALEGLIVDGSLRERLGAGARRFALGFSWDHSADAMARALTAGLALSRGRG
jgi:glycosyltransferase involved in cell wall biosynthesis